MAPQRDRGGSLSALQPLGGKAQRCAHLCTARINIFEGSVRSSKTIVSLLAWLLFVRTGPDGNLLMVGKTERTLKRNVIDPLTEWLGPKRCRYVQGSGELWLLGRRIYVAGANDERAQDRIRGLTLVGAYVDEATILPESFWRMLLTRLSLPGARLIATTNPDGPSHWLMRADQPSAGFLLRARLWIDHDGVEHHDDSPEALDLHRFSFRLRDNPTLAEEYVRSLEQEFTGMWRLRFIEGLWVIADGVIWDMFDPAPGGRHVTDTVPDTVGEWHVAIDDGTAGTFAAQLIACTNEHLVVARELRWNAKERTRQITDGQKSTMLAEWLQNCATGTLTDRTGATLPALPTCRSPRRIHVDPAATSLIRQLEVDGWRGSVVKARNDVADGIRYVASLFALDRLQVHESCAGLRQEIPGYVWDPKAAAHGEDKPVKVNDHHCDATRYGVMGTADWWWDWTANATLPLETVDAA